MVFPSLVLRFNRDIVECKGNSTPLSVVIDLKTICNDLQFVASWIYLYTMNWKKTMVTGITAYKRRSPNVL